MPLHVTRGRIVLRFLKTTVDDTSADQRAKTLAIYVLLLAANIVVWTWAVLALEGRPTSKKELEELRRLLDEYEGRKP